MLACSDCAGSRRIDVDEYGGTQVVHAEGVPPALGTFTLFWVVTHTTLHS